MPKAMRILQGNLNRCAAAQDLVSQTIRGWDIDLAVLAEPYRVPDRGEWMGDGAGLVAIFCSPMTGSPPPVIRERGEGYVACAWRGYAVIGAYFSPNRRLVEFEEYLETLAGVVNRLRPLPTILAGDLNAKSVEWGNPRNDAQGDTLAEWARSVELDPANIGNTWTCVRANGGSVVDVTFASPPAAQAIRAWRVVTEEETFSDHRYIRFDLGCRGETHRVESSGNRRSRWSVKKMDAEALRLTAAVEMWPAATQPETAEWVEEEATRLCQAMSRCCDASMPRSKGAGCSTKSVYWWTEEIASLRRGCTSARRAYLRQRRRSGGDAERETALQESYATRRKRLRAAIRDAKSRAWSELLKSLDEDPWGKPFLMVRKKMAARGAGNTTSSLESPALEKILAALFPLSAVEAPRATRDATSCGRRVESPEVTEAELRRATESAKRRGTTAPGPDGIPVRAWLTAMPLVGARVRRLFTECLRRGLFPSSWKVGRLVLLEKPGRPVGTPGAYRPICILNEVAKLYERVIAERLLQHLRLAGPDLSERQYGFRRGRSTIDAIRWVAAKVEEATASGRVVIGVSVDIANAFNCVPWDQVLAALEHHEAPEDLKATIADYFRDRYVEYENGGAVIRREVRCGVPQGSVLGPILWNLAYDAVLREPLPPGVETVCFADDTLVIAEGGDWEEAKTLAEEGTRRTIASIVRIGLRVETTKCEAIAFRPARKRKPRDMTIDVAGTRVTVGEHLKYLGLTLDSRWLYQEHFRRLGERLKGEVSRFGRLMPNLDGPGDHCRRLYLSVVRSIAMYGAPAWHQKIKGCKSILRILHGCQKTLNIRATRCYRTVAYDAACVLAGTPPWELEAETQGRLYEWRKERQHHRPTIGEVEQERTRLRGAMMARWGEQLEEASYGRATIEAIGPQLTPWVGRKHGQLDFHLVQMLTGHGCFGRYLHRIPKREESPKCHHCGAEMDDVEHTLVACPAWSTERAGLVDTIGSDLSLPSIVRRMVERRDCWAAMTTFASTVLRKKEEDERQREAAPDARPTRRARRRGGGRR